MTHDAVGRAAGSVPPFGERSRAERARPLVAAIPTHRSRSISRGNTHHPLDCRLLPSCDPLPFHYLQIPVFTHLECYRGGYSSLR
jgi:hypothetical protein